MSVASLSNLLRTLRQDLSECTCLCSLIRTTYIFFNPFFSKKLLLFSSRSLDLQTLWKFCIGDPCLSTTSNAAYKDGRISWGNLELLISFSYHSKGMIKRLACSLRHCYLITCKKKNNPPPEGPLFWIHIQQGEVKPLLIWTLKG